MPPGALPQYVDLTSALSVPRRALRELNPPLRPGARWTLPVLYQDLHLLQVVRPARASAAGVPAAASDEDWRVLRAKAETVAGFLAALPPETPASARDRMLLLLEQPPVVPAALRPDRWGRLGRDVAPGG
jgi:hypothetical protein